MAKSPIYQNVITMREKGATYSEISAALSIPKSTLSNWLHNQHLTDEQIALLNRNRSKRKILGIEKIRNTKFQKWQTRLQVTYDREKTYWVPLSTKELVLAGLFLYWGEGSKFIKGAVCLTNSDPNVIRFALRWLIEGLTVPIDKIRIYLHLYSDMDIDAELKFWSETLHVPLTQFTRPYIKKSRLSQITQKGWGHGTCALIVNDVRLKERIMMAIQSISDYYRNEDSAMI